MQSITLQGRFGVYYRLYLQPSRVASLRVKPVLFNDIAYTCQFIRSLNALPSYWQQLATHLGVPASQRANTHQLEHVIAKRLIAGHLHLYALTATPSHSAPKSQRLLKDKHNKEIEITLPQQLLNEGRVPNQAFTNASDAFAFISELNPSNEQLRVLAASLDITAPPNQHQAKIAQKIAAGDACIVVTQANNNTLIEHVDAQPTPPKRAHRFVRSVSKKRPTHKNNKSRLMINQKIPSLIAVIVKQNNKIKKQRCRWLPNKSRPFVKIVQQMDKQHEVFTREAILFLGNVKAHIKRVFVVVNDSLSTILMQIRHIITVFQQSQYTLYGYIL